MLQLLGNIAPIPVVHICLGDGPRQRWHAGMHRWREGAGVDVVLQQQHLPVTEVAIT